MIPREALLAAARKAMVLLRHHNISHTTANEIEAALALAEQEDQRGAAATCTEGASSETGESQNRASDGKLEAQSAPHPDPAGQVSPQTGADRPQGDARANQPPALPGLWCTYCGSDTHEDAKCWSTRPRPWGQKNLGYKKQTAEPGPETVSAAGSTAKVCCLEYATCLQPCVPRWEWIAEERLRGREPTREMRQAGVAELRNPYWSASDYARVCAIYRAMLAAGSAK